MKKIIFIILEMTPGQTNSVTILSRAWYILPNYDAFHNTSTHFQYKHTLWRRNMERLSTLLPLMFTCGFPLQRASNANFDVFDVSMNKLLNKRQSCQ